MGCAQRRRQWRGVEDRELLLGLVEASDEKKATNLKLARMGGVRLVAMILQHRPRHVQRLLGPGEIAGGERHFRLGNDASCARKGLLRAEAARGLAQEQLRARKIAELRHRDA